MNSVTSQIYSTLDSSWLKNKLDPNALMVCHALPNFGRLDPVTWPEWSVEEGHTPNHKSGQLKMIHLSETWGHFGMIRHQPSFQGSGGQGSVLKQLPSVKPCANCFQ